MISLPEHYRNTLSKQNLNAEELPDNLYFTFCGDILGSSGEHYEKGSGKISLERAAQKALPHYSDDFSESLAMHQLSDRQWNTDLNSLIKSRDVFLDLIRQHYFAYGAQYSPWAAALFEEKKVDRYGILIARHSSCGAAMRAAALAPHKLSDEQMLPFFLITHANIQAVEGAYIIESFARAAMKGMPYETCMQIAEQKAIQARKMAWQFLDENSLPVYRDIDVMDAIKTVLDTGDPYAKISDIKKDGIETHFVVASAFYLLSNLETDRPETNGTRSIIEGGLKIGGDPDTICSITMTLYGFLYPEKAKKELDDISIVP